MTARIELQLRISREAIAAEGAGRLAPIGFTEVALAEGEELEPELDRGGLIGQPPCSASGSAGDGEAWGQRPSVRRMSLSSSSRCSGSVGERSNTGIRCS